MTMDAALRELRGLAHTYWAMAHDERYQDNWRLHRAVNDRNMIRPVVLVDELPWHEMDFDGSLAPRCDDPVLRDVEIHLRRMVYRHKHFPADMVVPPFLPVYKVIRDSGVGLEVEENTLSVDDRNHIISHEYHDVLADEAVLDTLHPPRVEYDHEATMRAFQRVGDALGDILPIRLSGVGGFYCTVWDWISRLRGVEALLIDLTDRPEYTHRMCALLFSFEEARLRQYEALGLLDSWPTSLHCTAAAVSDLPGSAAPTRKDIWGRGAAQIFASVSPAMHEDFDIAYQMNGIGTCGLSYYGCCEPLDGKLPVVEKLPNLRKIGLTPWANARVLAEGVGGRFVVSAKPNPASVAVPNLDRDVLRKEIGVILGACRDFGCSCDLTLKDISTCAGNPENIFNWEKTVMEMVRNA